MFELVLAGLHFHQPILSVATGVAPGYLGKLTDPNLPLIRTIPSLNVQILKSATAIYTNGNASAKLLATARETTDSFGSALDIPKKDFDTFIVLAGSSPTYTYLSIEAPAKASIKYGIPKEKLLDIVTQTVLTSTENLLQDSDSPHDLIGKISSLGGTTVAGLLDLKKTGLIASVISSIDATIDKAKAL